MTRPINLSTSFVIPATLKILSIMAHPAVTAVQAQQCDSKSLDIKIQTLVPSRIV